MEIRRQASCLLGRPDSFRVDSMEMLEASWQRHTSVQALRTDRFVDFFPAEVMLQASAVMDPGAFLRLYNSHSWALGRPPANAGGLGSRP